MTAKAKKKKPPSQKQVEREIDAHLAELDEYADRLFTYAEPIYKAQEQGTKLAIDRAVAQMKKMAGNPSARVKVTGYPDPFTVRIEDGIQHKSFVYIAVKLFVYAARMDVQIGKFKLLPKSCAECGRKVK